MAVALLTPLLIGAAIAMAAGGAQASPFFMGLGDLPGGTVNSRATGVSDDGKVVVGTSFSGSGQEAFRWTAGTGMVGLGDFPGGDFFSGANGVSADGSVVVGSGQPAPFRLEGFRWTAGTGLVGLGDLGFPFSDAKDVSADGSVVVGQSANTASEAFSWTSGGGMVGLGDLPGGDVSSSANGVSADGSVVVGGSKSGSGEEAFRWTSGGGMVGLGDPGGGSFTSRADAVSADGSTVVGFRVNGFVFEAFRWTAGGGMVGLAPTGFTSSNATDVSGDGSVVVGGSQVGAFIWDSANGMRSFQNVLVNDFGLNLTGWRLAAASAISTDGNFIAGWGFNPNGEREAFLAGIGGNSVSVPEPGALAIFGLGLLGLRTVRRRRRRLA